MVRPLICVPFAACLPVRGDEDSDSRPEAMADLEADHRETLPPHTKSQKRTRTADKPGKAPTAAAKRKAAAAAAKAAKLEAAAAEAAAAEAAAVEAAVADCAADTQPDAGDPQPDADADLESLPIVEQPLGEDEQVEATLPASINRAASPADKHAPGKNIARQSARVPTISDASALPGIGQPTPLAPSISLLHPISPDAFSNPLKLVCS